jgi:hypothetical protein
MFRIDRTARGDRLEADAVLTTADFQRIAKELLQPPLRARKIGYVAARRAEKDEVVETRSNGKETTNTAHPGDWIVTNLSPQLDPLQDDEGHMNVYVIVGERFPQLYEPAEGDSQHGALYRARGRVVSALPFPGGLDIVAPWGERQTASAGYLLCNDEDVYGVGQTAFDGTYEVVGG